MTNNLLSRLSVEQLKRAASIRGKIETLERELDRIIGQPTTSSPGQRGFISAAGRARIAEAQRARWARERGGVKPARKSASSKKPTISAAGRARLSALAKARWAKTKASGHKKL